ncbi:MAG: KH domain-containing protein [Oscillatoriales cyanobacterium SM2_2_1]|nr:KH domain-containing protein [Oscillatoriales cyanobacterium SM2_2_1]
MALPDLALFLLRPLIEQPEALKFHCEQNAAGTRIWLRVAIADEDRGRLLGRGGRIVQSIRTVLNLAAQQQDVLCHLEIYSPEERRR